MTYIHIIRFIKMWYINNKHTSHTKTFVFELEIVDTNYTLTFVFQYQKLYSIIQKGSGI